MGEFSRTGDNISYENVQGWEFLRGCLDPMQDYNSLCVAVVIWAADVNTHTQRQPDRFQTTMYD